MGYLCPFSATGHQVSNTAYPRRLAFQIRSLLELESNVSPAQQ